MQPDSRDSDLSRDGRLLLVIADPEPGVPSPGDECFSSNLTTDTSQQVSTTHVPDPEWKAGSWSAASVVTGGADGVVRVGPVTGEEAPPC